MIAPKNHKREAERLKDLVSYSILDSIPEADFDYLTSMASEICGTPISLISLIDNKRQWFKSHHGLDVSETPKEYAFCAHAINDQNNVLIVQDARKDERFYDNPLVTGDPHVIFYAGVPLISEGGLPLGTLCVIDNKPKALNQNQIRSLNALSNQVMNLITLRKKKILLEQSLKKMEEKNRELEQFAFVACHDLREPLNTITSFVEILEENSKDDLSDIEKQSFQFINNASTRMNFLINGILDYGRLGKRSEISEVNCNTLIKNVIEDLDPIIARSNAKIKIGKLPIINAYEIELGLLFKYLISNAIKFTKPDITPEITITSEKNGTIWKFIVKDNGIGIDLKHKDKIFMMFQTLHKRNEYDGTGIGLAHSRKIGELHNGDIWFDSKLDIGSTFYFTINENILN